MFPCYALYHLFSTSKCFLANHICLLAENMTDLQRLEEITQIPRVGVRILNGDTQHQELQVTASPVRLPRRILPLSISIFPNEDAEDLNFSAENPVTEAFTGGNDGGTVNEALNPGNGVLSNVAPGSPLDNEVDELNDDATLALVFESPSEEDHNAEVVCEPYDSLHGGVASNGALHVSVNTGSTQNESVEEEDIPHVAENVLDEISDDDDEEQEMYEKHGILAVSGIADNDTPYTKESDGAGGSTFVQKVLMPNLRLIMPNARLTFIPLQKWEYDNGFPVDGVTDTREWAKQVGLDAGNEEGENARKRIKIGSAIEPPKYYLNAPLVISSPEDDGISTETLPGSPSYEEDKVPTSRKGKERME